MSGSCVGCGGSFGLFKKEAGCKNCGMVFCRDCLSKKAPIPKHNNEVHRVCSRCHKVLTGQINPTVLKHSPPEVHKKKMAALSVHNKLNNVSISKAKNKKVNEQDEMLRKRLENLKKDNNLDMPKNIANVNEIQKRLDGLKDRENIPSVDEIRSRVAKLRGEPSMRTAGDQEKTSNLAVQANANASSYDCADKLIEAAMAEVKLDRKIRGQNVNSDASTSDSADDLIKAAMADVKLNKEKLGESGNVNFCSLNSKDYSKKFLPPCEDFLYSTNESISFTELQIIVTKVASECDLDAEKALNDIQKDNEVMEQISKYYNRKKNGNIASNADPSDLNSSLSEMDNGSDDEEENIKKIILDALEEDNDELSIHSASNCRTSPKIHPKSKADDKNCNIEVSVPSAPSANEFEEELPWCVLCSADAVLRCIDCDGDLYCRRCFREFHKDEDEDHITSYFDNRDRKQR